MGQYQSPADIKDYVGGLEARIFALERQPVQGAITVLAPFTSVGVGLQYFVDGQGNVRFGGAISWANNQNLATIANFPAAITPAVARLQVVAANATGVGYSAAELSISAAGTCVLLNGPTGAGPNFAYFDQVTYRLTAP